MGDSGDDKKAGRPDLHTIKIALDALLPENRAEEGARTAAMTAIAGAASGKVFFLDRPDSVIGRADDAQIKLLDEGISRTHARIQRTGDEYAVIDLQSTNGTFVNGARISAPTLLHEGDCINLGARAVLQFELRSKLEESFQQRLYELATRDGLTGALNRRSFDERFIAEWAWSSRHSQPCIFCMFDIDLFKNVNDEHGHQAGDYVLSEVSLVTQELLRKEDIFARYGGEEFVVLTRATSAADGESLAERIRSGIEQHVFIYNGVQIKVTASFGVAISIDPVIASPSQLVAHADAALYRAKREGRNRVVIAT